MVFHCPDCKNTGFAGEKNLPCPNCIYGERAEELFGDALEAGTNVAYQEERQWQEREERNK